MYLDSVIITVLFLIIFVLPASFMVVGFGKRYEQSVFANWCVKPASFWQWGIAVFAGVVTLFCVVTVVLALGLGIIGLGFPSY